LISTNNQIIQAIAVNIACNSVSTAGDVNGDGLNDLIVGARGKLKAGKFYVIFGKKDNTTIDLSAIASSMSTNNQII
jgi:hypothetical protein